MTLWVFIVPALLILATAIFAHCRRETYWPAVRWTVIASVLWILPYFVVLRFVVIRSDAEWYEPLKLLAVGVGGGLVAGCVAMLVGLSFAADRHIVKPVNWDDDAA